MKNKTCQSVGELTVSQQPSCKSWQGVATHQGASITMYGQWLGCGWLSSRSDTLVTIFLKYPFQCLSCCHGNLCPAWCSCLPSWQIAWATSSVVNCTAVQYFVTSQQLLQMWLQKNEKTFSAVAAATCKGIIMFLLPTHSQRKESQFYHVLAWMSFSLAPAKKILDEQF